MTTSIGSLLSFAAIAGLPATSIASQVPTPRERTAPLGAVVAARPDRVPTEGAVQVPVDQRTKVLGRTYRQSTDIAWATSGDGARFHVLAASARSGYAWNTLATLAEPGVEADSWIGNACVTGDGRSLVVVYAPRVATNQGKLFDRGGFAAVVRMKDGAVTKLPLTSSLAYFSPSCGNGDDAVITQYREDATAGGQTRIYRVDASTAAVTAPVQVPGELTSAVPVGRRVVAADANALVSVDARGRRRIIAVGRTSPFHLTPDADGGLVYLDRQGPTATFMRVGAAELARGRSNPTLLASGPLAGVGISRTVTGAVYLTGAVTLRRALPPQIAILANSTSRTAVSTEGELSIESVRPAGLSPSSAAGDPTQLERPVQIRTTVQATGAKPVFVVSPSSGTTVAALSPHPALRATAPRAPRTALAAGAANSPLDGDRTCAVARNDVRSQTMQPKPRQVEWAVNQAVRGALYTPRATNWKNLGMPFYSPQGLFPPRALAGGGSVPSQVFLGIIAQESNMWMAPDSVVPGVTGNPLIGNYYGLDIYDGNKANDWDIRFTEADCGYGVTQITDGMRIAGRTKPGEVALPPDTQRAAALDYAANISGGLQILQEKWNQTRSAGLIINNGDVSRLENWFYAVWAYNSGFHPQSEAGANAGAWGVGWLNNPANPQYPANRRPFLEDTYEDARHPQDWPYPEKVMGWAGHPVEILESPGTLVSGFRAAWWPGVNGQAELNRAMVKPPVNQFCTTSDNCVPEGKYTPTAPDVVGEPAGPCAHRNGDGKYDLKCWANAASTWKQNCQSTCGREFLRFDPGYAEQADCTAYGPNCGLVGLPPGAHIIDDQTDATPVVRPGCVPASKNQGSFTLTFPATPAGEYPSKTDFHQLGAGFNGHFWYAHTRAAELREGSMAVTGTWELNRPLTQWARVFVHMPDHGAHTQQARYEVDLGNGKRTRIILQRVMANQWVSLGSFPFNGTPKVQLVSNTYDGDNGAVGRPVQSEDIAYDAVAFQPLAAKPKNIVVSLGDSYSSGEGGSSNGGGDYYKETDNNGNDPDAQNACHRSSQTWSRRATIAGTTGVIGALSDNYSDEVEHHLIACSGAQTENLLPLYTAGTTKPQNAWQQNGVGEFGELSQLDKGFVDEDTTLVTLSIGGNDSRFGDIIAECLVAAGLKECPDARLPGSTIAASEEIPALVRGKVEDSIVTVLAEIRKKAPNAKILLMGYPRLFQRDGSCVIGLGPGEASWLNEMSALLLARMQQAVDRANATAGTKFTWFSDPSEPFTGKTVCGDPETVHGIVGPQNRTPGEGTFPSSGGGLAPSQQSFHPTVDGYEHYATSMNITLRLMGL